MSKIKVERSKVTGRDIWCPQNSEILTLAKENFGALPPGFPAKQDNRFDGEIQIQQIAKK